MGKPFYEFTAILGKSHNNIQKCFIWCRLDLMGSRGHTCFNFPPGLSLNIWSG